MPFRSIVAEAADGEDHESRIQLFEATGSKPSRSRVPGRKFSTRTSARRSSSRNDAFAFRGLEVQHDRLLVPVARKEVGGLAALGVSTNGGPQPRVSSPPSGFSTLMTRAPRSPSIMAACGPARARERSTTSLPASGPLVLLVRQDPGTLLRLLRRCVRRLAASVNRTVVPAVLHVPAAHRCLESDDGG